MVIISISYEHSDSDMISHPAGQYAIIGEFVDYLDTVYEDPIVDDTRKI
jgi:hypothetical protein